LGLADEAAPGFRTGSVSAQGPDRANTAPVRFRSGLDIALAGVLTAALVRLWLMPLPSSFWVDEMGTAFVVRHGAGDLSLRVAPQVAQSIYYALPEISTRWLGESETAYRLPSVLAMAVALLLIFRLAARLIHPAAGWFAAFACLSLRGFNYQAADARPYGLGTAVTCASLWFLVRWLDSARWRDALGFAVAASLVWRVHLMLWPVYAVLALYTLARLHRGNTPVRWGAVAAVFAALGVSLLPVAAQALALFQEAGKHVVARPPSLEQLARSLKFGLIAGCGAAAALISRWRKWEPAGYRPSGPSLAFIGAWWLGPPLCLFLYSRLTAASVFLDRYFYVALPGAALAAAAAAAVFIPPRRWKIAALVFGLGVLALVGQWNRVGPPHQISDWRGAARALGEQRLGPGVPVIAPSPFIEARPPVWRPDYPIDSFLYSHLLVYKFPGRIYPFPFQNSPQAEQFAIQLSQQVLAGAGKFVIYGETPKVLFWRDWFQSRPEFIGWHIRRLGPFGDVEVVEFEKAG
jgi:hypothetical protein